MKRTVMDRVVGFFSPKAELRRLQTRAASEIVLRGYDSAQTYPTSEWTSASKFSANSEIKAAQSVLRERARDLARNNPYGVRAIDVIVSNTVGSGIVPNIKGKSSQTKVLNELWKQFAETPMIDAEGRHDFYGLQSLVMRATATDGEILGVKRTAKDGLKVQLLESDYIATSLDEGKIVQGVEVDPFGKPVKYHVLKSHPGDRDPSDETVALPATDVAHVFKQTRPGQKRGISWAHAVIEKLKDFDDYQSATLIRQKVAACFGGFITTSGADALMDSVALKEKRQNEFAMQPATFRYLSPGEDVKLASPPGVDGYSEFTRETLRAAAAAWGISAESFTGDYSQSNYSSSRMGHLEMRRNIDSWRWNMLIPQFCDPVFRWFLEWASTQGVNVEGVTVEWVPPAHTMIDPAKDVMALQREVRSGFKTWGQAVREQGLDPESLLLEQANWNQRFDDLKMSFDSDPRRMSQIGFAQAGDALSKLSEAEYLRSDEQTTHLNTEDENSEEQDESNASEESASGDGE